MGSLSIITVNYNDAQGLNRTLHSIDNVISKYDLNVELYVIDGGSKDESLNVIEKFKNIITDHVSEKDNGIYDAMNKGLALCDGDFVLFLNSGDYFNEDASLDILITNMKQYKNKVIFWSAKIKAESDFWFYPPLDVKSTDVWMNKNLPNHQAMLFPKCFYKKNRYDLSMKVISDADYKYRAIKEFGYVYIPLSLSTFEMGGLSSQKFTWKTLKIRLKDFLIYANKHYSGIKYILEVLKHTGKYTVKLLLSILLSDDKYSKFFKK
ncbi:glycosyltransferase [Photobacterium leiognathi]|uniref:glycosyltransferase n=1 Tax=Photobacterium leiognathi TaxID=553611 RepID=UPI002981FC2B|nr:glycosyltransferase [Photobacterium leiognathi]